MPMDSAPMMPAMNHRAPMVWPHWRHRVVGGRRFHGRRERRGHGGPRHLRVRLNRGSPLTLGLPEEIAIWSEQSPAFDSAASSVASYPPSGVLASGWLLGENLLAGQSALVDVKAGAGHVLLFGMRPQYRAQSYQAYKLFFNALLYH